MSELLKDIFPKYWTFAEGYYLPDFFNRKPAWELLVDYVSVPGATYDTLEQAEEAKTALHALICGRGQVRIEEISVDISPKEGVLVRDFLAAVIALDPLHPLLNWSRFDKWLIKDTMVMPTDVRRLIRLEEMELCPESLAAFQALGDSISKALGQSMVFMDINSVSVTETEDGGADINFDLLEDLVREYTSSLEAVTSALHKHALRAVVNI